MKLNPNVQKELELAEKIIDRINQAVAKRTKPRIRIRFSAKELAVKTLFERQLYEFGAKVEWNSSKPHTVVLVFDSSD